MIVACTINIDIVFANKGHRQLAGRDVFGSIRKPPLESHYPGSEAKTVWQRLASSAAQVLN
jgi:hypothetical protein